MKKKARLMTVFVVLLVMAVLIGVIPVSLYSYQSAMGMTRRISDQLLQEKIEAGLRAMNVYMENAYGQIRMQNGTLVDEASQSFQGRYEIIDRISEELGVVATLFARDGQDFIRLITSIRQDDGQRAIGTYLGRDSAAYQPIMSRRTYIGEAIILGDNYLTGYEPIVDASGQVIGILFLGIPIEFIQTTMAEFTGQFSIVLLLIAGLSLFVSIFVGIFIIRRIVKRIQFLLEAALKIGNNDLRVQLPEETGDEIGMLVGSFRQMVDNLKANAVLLRKFSRELESTSLEVNDISVNSKSMMEQSNNEINNSAQSTGNLSASVEQINASLEEISSQSQENLAQVESLRKISDEMSAVTTNGSKALKGIIEVVHQVETQAEQDAEEMQELKKSVENISTIVQTITLIAEQTNLLALNAAIEAARAGEAGKGFSVVADEIRKLAEGSKKATQDITSMLKEIEQRTLNTASKATELFHSIGNTKTQAHVMSDEMNLMMKKITGVVEVVDNVVHLVGDQSATIEEISASMNTIAQDTQQISHNLDSVLDGVTTQTENANTLSADADQLSKAAKELKEFADRYQLP